MAFGSRRQAFLEATAASDDPLEALSGGIDALLKLVNDPKAAKAVLGELQKATEDHRSSFDVVVRQRRELESSRLKIDAENAAIRKQWDQHTAAVKQGQADIDRDRQAAAAALKLAENDRLTAKSLLTAAQKRIAAFEAA
jgi:hypothetical protein